MSDIYGTQNDVLLQNGLADALDGEDFDVKLKSLKTVFGKIGHQDFMTGSKRIGQKSLKLLLSCHQEKALELKEDSTQMVWNRNTNCRRRGLEKHKYHKKFRV